jgi:GNAT superfamily N-acetyltransferase
MAIEDKISYETIVLSNHNEVINFYKKSSSKFKQIYDIFDKELKLGSHLPFKEWVSNLANDPKTTFILINKNKEVIGAIYGYNSADNKKFNLSMFAVKKEHQGKLYGTKLMAKAFAIILRNGYESIEMNALKKTKMINEYLTGQLFDNRWKKRKFKSGFKYQLVIDSQHPFENKIIKQKIPRRSIAK